MLHKNDIRALLLIAAFYAVIELAGVTCPIRWLTGISCAGCGMSRAWLSLLRLDLSAAFAYHPLFWLPIPAALVLLFRQRLPKALVRWTLGAACALFLVVYVIRMLQPEDAIVTFAPRTGAVYRILARLIG